MDNTDKKQPMSDEELSKISGGSSKKHEATQTSCPYCFKDFGMLITPQRLETHISVCNKNPNRI